MAKLRKPEKRAVSKKSHDSKPYLKLAKIIMKGEGKVRVDRKKLAVEHEETHKAIARAAARVGKPPEPEPPKIEVTVRSIYYDGQFLPALCFRTPGALHVPCVVGDSVEGIRKFTVTSMQHDKSVPIQHGQGILEKPYSAERFASHLRRIAATKPISPEARTLLLPYAPDLPAVLVSPEPGSHPVAPYTTSDSEPRRPIAGGLRVGGAARSEPARTSGKELIRSLSVAAGLPPEKVRARLRVAGMRAPYVDAVACRKALGVKS